MKSLSLIAVCLLVWTASWAQTPSKFNYQAVARDGAGDLVASSTVAVKVSILSGSATGTSVYSEEHTPSTNAYGLFNFQIGAGTNTSGDLASVDWGSDAHFISIEMDPDGGTNYSVTSTQELVSVPYAEYANSVANDAVEDADADPANELQFLSQSGDTISISNGNSIVFQQQIPENLDNDSTNEFQTISLSGDDLTLSDNGGTVDLSGYDQSADVATNASDIADNASDIATNASDIADNTTDIAANTSDIADNASDIADNATDIAANTSDIADNASDIADNATDIAANTSDIADNASDIADNATDIATNASDISDNASDIADNASDIADNATDIATNASDIAAHAAADLDTDSTNELITSTAFVNDSTLMIYEGVDSFSVDLSTLIDDNDWIQNGDTLFDTNHTHYGIGSLNGAHTNPDYALTLLPSSNLGGLYIQRNSMSANNYGLRLYDYNSSNPTTGSYLNIEYPQSTAYGSYNRIYDGSGTGYGSYNYIYSPGGTSYGTYNNVYDGTTGYGVYNYLYSSSSNARGVYNYMYYNSSTTYGTDNYLYYNSGYSNGTRNYLYGNYSSGVASYNYLYASNTSQQTGIYAYTYQNSTGYSYGADLRTYGRGYNTYGAYKQTYNYYTSNYGSSYGSYNYAYKTGGYYGRAYGTYNYANAGGSYDYAYGTYNYAYGGYYANYASFSSGYTYSTSGYYSSDRKLKKNIRDYEGAISDIMELKPRVYDFDRDAYPTMGLPEEEQLGLVAQELEEVFPNLIKDAHNPALQIPESDAKEQGLTYKVIREAEYDEEGKLMSEAMVEAGEEVDFKAVNYNGLIPVLIKGIQEQQEIINALEARIEQLEAE